MADAAAAVVELLDDVLAVPVYGGSFRGSPPGVLVRASGGGVLAAGWMPTVDVRVDVRAYGDTDWEAAEIDRQAAVLLHNVRSTDTGHGLIRWCRIEGGPNQIRESDTGWTAVLSTWQVYGDWLD